MNVYQIKAGTTDVSVVLRIIDSTDGTPETGVVYNTSGIDLEYRREGAATVDITEATLAALTTAHTDGGFLHIGNGYYRLDLPDAAVAAGATGVLVHGTVTGMVVIGCYIQLVAYDPFDTVRLGLTALPNAAAEASGGLYTRGTGAGQINQANNGQIDANAARTGGTTNTGRDIGASVLLSSGTGTGQLTLTSGRANADITHIAAAAVSTTTAQLGVNVVQVSGDGTAADNAESFFDGTGYAGTNNVIPTVTTLSNAPSDSSGTTTLLSRLSSARAGYLDNLSAGAVALASSLSTLAGVFTGITSLAQWLGLIAGKQTGNSTARTELRATGAGSGTFDETTDSQEAVRDRGDAAWTTATGFSTLDAAAVRAAVGLASANLDTQLADLPTNAELATSQAAADDATLAAIAALTIPTAAAIADAVWDEAIAGHAGAGSTGEALAGATAPSAAAIADAVWDEAISGHAGSGSTGEALAAAGGAGDPWITALPGGYSAGQAGKIVGDYLNATVSSRASQTSVDDLPTNAELATALAAADDAVLAAIAALNNLSQANIRTAVGLGSANLDTQLADLPTNAELATALGTADDAVLAAIAALNNLSQANVRAAVGLASANLDTQIGTLATAAALAVVDGVVDAILDDTGTTGVTVAAASKTGYRLSSAGVDDVLDEAVEGSTTLRESVRLANAALGGKASGLATTTAVYRDLADSKNRLSATVDADGNRSAVTRDLT